MSRPRPANMFQYPQESRLAPMRDKLLFIEALTASGHLTGRELRVAILLTMRYSTSAGCAKPSMDYIAAALGLDKSNVAKLINSLVSKRWFFVERGNFSLGGKGHVNQYRPNAERVPSATPFHDHVTTDVPDAKGVKTSVKGVKTTAQRVSPATTDTVIDTVYNTDTVILRMTSRSQSDDEMDISDPQCVMGQLNIIERCLAARKPGTWTETHESALQTLADYCDSVCEVYGTDGNPVGGKAYRLAQDLGWELNNLVPAEQPRAAPRRLSPDPYAGGPVMPLLMAPLDESGPASAVNDAGVARRLAPPRVPTAPIRGPASSAQFGPWLGKQVEELGVPLDHIASMLRVDVTEIRHMTRTDERGRGLYLWPSTQRRKVEYALTTWISNSERKS